MPTDADAASDEATSCRCPLSGPAPRLSGAQEPVAGDTFTVGTVVRLVGLQRSEFNHHLGRVVTSQKSQAGRVAVALHGVAWPPARRGSDSVPMAFKQENLRRVTLPSPTRGCRAIWGSVAPDIVSRMFGESGFGLPANVAELIADHLRIWRWIPTKSP